MTLRERFACLPRNWGVEDELVLEIGSMKDYASLSEYHYRAARPAAPMRVWAACYYAEKASDRFVGRGASRRVVGVLVESVPCLDCKMRNWALRGRYSGLKSARQRGDLVSREIRCISRVVVHPQWRGLGIAVRLVRTALSEPETLFTEALAAMGHVNPFFEQAGMIAYHRRPHAHDMRLREALGSVGIEPVDLGLLEGVFEKIEGLPGEKRRWLWCEVERWYRASLRRSRGDCVGSYEQLRVARERLLCVPVYYLKDNRVNHMHLD